MGYSIRFKLGQMLHGQMLHGQMLHGQILHGQMFTGQRFPRKLTTHTDGLIIEFG